MCALGLFWFSVQGVTKRQGLALLEQRPSQSDPSDERSGISCVFYELRIPSFIEYLVSWCYSIRAWSIKQEVKRVRVPPEHYSGNSWAERLVLAETPIEILAVPKGPRTQIIGL